MMCKIEITWLYGCYKLNELKEMLLIVLITPW